MRNDCIWPAPGLCIVWSERFSQSIGRCYLALFWVLLKGVASLVFQSVFRAYFDVSRPHALQKGVCCTTLPQGQLARAYVVSRCICLATLPVLVFRTFGGNPFGVELRGRFVSGRERRLECEAVGALRRCGSFPGRCSARLVGDAIGGAREGTAAEVACGKSGAPSQAWERRF